MPGLEDYSSPILRASVFRRLHPGAQISYSVVAIDEAFPQGHREYEGRAVEAVRCEIIMDDGSFIVAHKEMDLFEQQRSGTKPVAQTPEQLAKDETKALGRALRDAGIPQRLSELKILMSWIASMDGSPNTSSSRVAPPISTRAEAAIADAFPGSTVEEEQDSPDAGSEDPTPEQLLAKAFGFLNGTDKQKMVAKGREMGVNNVLRAGEHAEELLAYLAALGTETEPEIGAQRARDIEALGNEEPF